jgi:AraC-like DNA-binding protein
MKNRKRFKSDRLLIEKISSPNYMTKPHRHEQYEIFLTTGLEGNASISIDGVKTTLKNGCVVIIDSNRLHETNYTYASLKKRYLIEIHPSLLPPSLGNSISLSIPNFFKEQTGIHYLNSFYMNKLENIFEMIYDESMFQETFFEEIALLRILEILLLVDRYEQDKKTNKKPDLVIEPIIKYISENVVEELSLEKLSDIFYISKTHLAHRFKRYTGITVHNFINQMKIEQAKRMITLDSTLTTKKIACYLNYRDSSYFGKVFKKYTGQSFREYRYNIKETIF